MSKPLSIFPALALAALVLFVAGCGGGDDEATGSGNGNDSTLAESDAPSSKAEFTKTAEDICYQSKRDRYYAARKYRQQHKKELEAMAPRPEYEKLIVAVILPGVMEEARELAALDPPKGDEKKIEAIIKGIEDGVKEARKDPYSVSLEEPLEYPFRKVGFLIRNYGLVDCRNVA